MFNALSIIMRGSFQARFATEPELPTKSPTCNTTCADDLEPSGKGPLHAGAGNGWTYAYDEVAFDRWIRFTKPVALRTHLIDAWKDATVDSLQVEDTGGKVQTVKADDLLAQVVSFGGNVFFWDPEYKGAPRGDPMNPTLGVGDLTKEELRGFKLTIGASLTADAVATPTNGGYGDITKWKTDYGTKKSQLGKNQGISPAARRHILQDPGWIDNYGNFFQKWGVFRDIALKDVAVNAARGSLKKSSLGDPKKYDWKMNVVFYRFDGDTLTGRMLAQLVATQPKVKAKLELEKDVGVLLSTWG